MRYIGSKINLLENIEEVIDINVKNNAKSFVDLFSGTGIVGEYFKKKYKVISNDNLYFSYVLQLSKIENNSIPKFEKLDKELGIEDPLLYLESEEFEIEDNYFITHNYSPYKDCNRMYFTVQNASRIDFIRQKINEWQEHKYINENEYYYLLASLIESVPYVSNISGTYGAYLKHWDKRALSKLNMQRFDVINNNLKNKSYNEDSNELIKRIEGDILYIDPPYNGRQYISNYHLLETIARYDYPDIYGKTGLRPYEEERSSYCLKKEVLNTFNSLIENAKFQYLLVSYSSDGLLNEEEIKKTLQKHGIKSSYKVYEIPYRKYKSKHKQKSNKLHEYIFYIEKDVKIKKNNGRKRSYKINKYKDKSFVKSPLNYIGGKYKILDQLIPLFPDEINNFVDLFAGGFNVGINVDANKIFASDINEFVLGILKTFKNKSPDDVVKHIEGRIKEYNLSKTNEKGYKKFRNIYNETKNPLDLYTLICFSFNYQLRFNNDKEYNNSFGRNRSQFSDNLREKLIRFINNLHEKNVEFINTEFEMFDFKKMKDNDFVYCDPPYLITTGTYNDGNRGFKVWDEKQEYKLLSLLDELNEKNIKFGLSNVLTHKGEKNNILIDWSSKYNVIHLNNNYSNSSYNTKKGKSEEVFITNYTE